MDDTDFREEVEILDTETFRSEKDQEFSHQSLVMAATRKVIEYGCQELITGYYNKETDDKGKVKIVYKQDTRKAFIESVRTLRMVMICDFDETARKKLIHSEKGKENAEENIMDKLKSREEFWISEESKWYNAQSESKKFELSKQGMGSMEGYLNINLPFFEQYFIEELNIYREIFEELTLLTSRLKFYGRKHYESGPSGSSS